MKVAVLPSSAVLPEILVMLYVSLPDTAGADGVQVLEIHFKGNLKS